MTSLDNSIRFDNPLEPMGIARVRESDGKPSFIGDGVNIAGTVQDTNNDDFVGTWKIVDRIFLLEDHPQIL